MVAAAEGGENPFGRGFFSVPEAVEIKFPLDSKIDHTVNFFEKEGAFVVGTEGTGINRLKSVMVRIDAKFDVARYVDGTMIRDSRPRREGVIGFSTMDDPMEGADVEFTLISPPFTDPMSDIPTTYRIASANIDIIYRDGRKFFIQRSMLSSDFHRSIIEDQLEEKQELLNREACVFVRKKRPGETEPLHIIFWNRGEKVTLLSEDPPDFFLEEELHGVISDANNIMQDLVEPILATYANGGTIADLVREVE